MTKIVKIERGSSYRWGASDKASAFVRFEAIGYFEKTPLVSQKFFIQAIFLFGLVWLIRTAYHVRPALGEPYK